MWDLRLFFADLGGSEKVSKSGVDRSTLAAGTVSWQVSKMYLYYEVFIDDMGFMVQHHSGILRIPKAAPGGVVYQSRVASIEECCSGSE